MAQTEKVTNLLWRQQIAVAFNYRSWVVVVHSTIIFTLRRIPLLWTLTMLRMRNIALCAHNVYSANHTHTLVFCSEAQSEKQYSEWKLIWLLCKKTWTRNVWEIGSLLSRGACIVDMHVIMWLAHWWRDTGTTQSELLDIIRLWTSVSFSVNMFFCWVFARNRILLWMSRLYRCLDFMDV